MENSMVRINEISIRNYKGIDALDLSFPEPLMPEDPDVFIMGSENGLGKTSILECCALLLLALEYRLEVLNKYAESAEREFLAVLIKADASYAEIIGTLEVENDKIEVTVKLHRSGFIEVQIPSLLNKVKLNRKDSRQSYYSLLQAVCGNNPNPLLEGKVLVFHGHRKVQEGNPELSMMLSNESKVRRALSSRYHRFEQPISTFKLEIVRALMGRANLFEFGDEAGTKDTIEKLNSLLLTYVSGTISKLRPTVNNTIDILVQLTNARDSFSFDALSSGQKEIISTLFLIWHATRDAPRVVLIDEPELHLNTQWHRSFIKKLFELAPNNQYIIATHSETVMDSVDQYHRVLLVNRER